MTIWGPILLVLGGLQWQPGLDLVVPLPSRTALIGYDQDTDTASWLDLSRQCAWQWSLTPTPGQGGIRAIVPIEGFILRLAIYHESGWIRWDDPPPEPLSCLPVDGLFRKR